MSGKLKITGNGLTPRDPQEVRAYCEGRTASAAGAPAHTYGSHISGMAANNNAIVWTAKLAGQGLAVGILPGGAAELNRPLTVSVEGLHVLVHPATDGTGAITSTAAEVMAAALASSANGLVSTANDGASDGTGVVVAMMPPRALTGSNVSGPAGNPLTEIWTLGFNSWSANPAGVGRDCCALPYGGGYTGP